MKRILYFISLLIIAISCKKELDINSYSLQLMCEIPDDITLSSYEGIKLTITNRDKEYNIIEYSDKNAQIYLEGLEAGFYNISATFDVITNGTTKTYNGTAYIDLFENLENTVELVHGNIGKFVIREYYYSASETPSFNQYKDDQYVEIFNNTSEIQYADGLSIVEHESYALSHNYWQYMEKDSIVVKMIWTVPGNGTDYPILPGKGFIIAQDAFNHKSDPDGNPNSPVDLGDAEFEFWSDKSPTGDIDFPATNMVEHFWVYKAYDVAFHNRGGSGIALVRLPGNKEEYILNNLVSKGEATSSSKYFCKIPNSMVVDAVEAMWYGKLYKRFDSSLDAGYIAVESGSKSGLCIRRKIKEIIDGRTVYQDTNNSSNDFEHDVVPSPRNYEN